MHVLPGILYVLFDELLRFLKNGIVFVVRKVLLLRLFKLVQIGVAGHVAIQHEIGQLTIDLLVDSVLYDTEQVET